MKKNTPNGPQAQQPVTVIKKQNVNFQFNGESLPASSSPEEIDVKNEVLAAKRRSTLGPKTGMIEAVKTLGAVDPKNPKQSLDQVRNLKFRHISDDLEANLLENAKTQDSSPQQVTATTSSDKGSNALAQRKQNQPVPFELNLHQVDSPEKALP